MTRQAVAKHLGVLDRRRAWSTRTAAGRERRYRVDDAQLARAVAQLAARRRDLGRPAAADQADRRGDPASSAKTDQQRPRPAREAEKEHEMVDILHRIGVERRVAGARCYDALTTLDGLAGWWTDDTTGDDRRPAACIEFRFGPGGFDMQVDELDPAKLVRWEVVDGPRGMDRHDGQLGPARRTATARS